MTEPPLNNVPTIPQTSVTPDNLNSDPNYLRNGLKPKLHAETPDQCFYPQTFGLQIHMHLESLICNTRILYMSGDVVDAANVSLLYTGAVEFGGGWLGAKCECGFMQVTRWMALSRGILFGGEKMSI
jgi:hypothetical protein